MAYSQRLVWKEVLTILGEHVIAQALPNPAGKAYYVTAKVEVGALGILGKLEDMEFILHFVPIDERN
jgi:hypothetical protein